MTEVNETIIRLIHHHGQISRQYELTNITNDYAETLELALQGIESELQVNHNLRLPTGITIRD